MKEKRTVAILVIDLAGYAPLENKHDIAGTFEREVLLSHSPLFISKQENGYHLFYDDCTNAAEAALSIRDHFVGFDWDNLGIPPLPVRMGIHYGPVSFRRENATIVKAIGEAIITAARIEPLAEPNSVYCSKSFHVTMQSKGASNIKGEDIGFHQLALGYGGLPLVHLKWQEN